VTHLDLQRRFLAEEVASTANVRTQALINALASIPRERFLPPGPWIIRGEGDAPTSQRKTPDADPRHVYHGIAVAIDSDRQLFNGAPTAVAPLM
jgi:protein-L-isoaspartate(D-aspartate) O-methyltransferase